MKKLLLIAAAVLLAPGIAAAADISGAWKITTNANGQDLVVNCNFAQSGSALSGTCGLAGGAETPAALTGTVDGMAASWAYDVKFQDMPLHVAFKGDVMDKTMSGTMDVAGGSSPFKAAKQ